MFEFTHTHALRLATVSATSVCNFILYYLRCSYIHFRNLWGFMCVCVCIRGCLRERESVIYRSVACHMSLKLQCPFSAEIISTKSGSYYGKRSVDVMIYYYL